MTTIFYAEPELVIALNRKVITVNPNDLQIFKEIELPEDLLKCNFKGDNESNEESKECGYNEESECGKSQAKQQLEPPYIQNVCLSPNQQLLAITTAGTQKTVLIYQCRLEHAKLVSVRPLARASSAVTFSADSKWLLVVDKTGDCYQYDCVDLQASARMLLGHLSIVYDVIWTPDSKYIITCDRDDKIRVTNYPATQDIHGYCLGHREFVSGLALLQDEVIVSVSGDKTLRLWNYQTSEELTKIDLPAPGVRLAVRPLGSKTFEAAVLLHQPNECVALYRIENGVEANWHIEERGLLNFSGMIAANLCFANERLYVAGVVEEHLVLKVAENTPEAPANWLEMVEEQFKMDSWKPENVAEWFKKRYDNVSEYLERKKRRIDDKQK